MQGGTLLFAQWTSHVRRAILAASAITVTVAVAASSLGDVPERSQLARMALVVGAVLAAATVAMIVRRIGLHPEITAATILGAVCIYLLIGLFFAYVFRIVDVFDGPFFERGELAVSTSLLYYSYSTLTTVGFGDLTASSDLGRMLSVLEALIGQLYLVTVVALVIGNLGRQRVRHHGGGRGEERPAPGGRAP
jgi:Ion channel